MRPIFQRVITFTLSAVLIAAAGLSSARADDAPESSNAIINAPSQGLAPAPRVPAPALSPEAATTLAAPGASVCLNAHLQDIGWQGWFCAPANAVVVVGTTGQSRRMEALAIVTNATSGVCANAHLQDIGWQGWFCGTDNQVVTVGTTGQSRRMEALAIEFPAASLCANAHLQDIGWQGWFCGGPSQVVVVGTTGQSRRMEALALKIF
jgi:uncharacterized protein YjdB